MAAIQRDKIWPAIHARKQPMPRLLGLTASFVNGSLKGIEQKRGQLESLLNATIFCPDLPVETQKTWTRIGFPRDSLSGYADLAETKVATLLEQIEMDGLHISDPSKVVSAAQHTLLETGMAGFLFYLREAIIPQLTHHVRRAGSKPTC